MTFPKFTRRMVLQSGAACAATLLCATPTIAKSQDRQAEGGIGGTGIVGLLTEFGSLYINGNYVRTDASTAFSDGFGPLQKGHLRVGHSLTVEASGSVTNLIARRVHVTHPLVGRISSIEENGMLMRVNGVVVALERRLQGFKVGDRVAVSGLWREQKVVASHLSRARSNLDLVSGDVSRGNGGVRIGPLRVVGGGIGRAKTNGFATAVGTFDAAAATMRAQRATSERFTGAAGALQRLSIEGYLERTASAPGVRVAGLGHSFERNLRFGSATTERLLLSGNYTGKFAVDRAVILPENLSARMRILRQIRAEK